MKCQTSLSGFYRVGSVRRTWRIFTRNMSSDINWVTLHYPIRLITISVTCRQFHNICSCSVSCSLPDGLPGSDPPQHVLLQESWQRGDRHMQVLLVTPDWRHWWYVMQVPQLCIPSRLGHPSHHLPGLRLPRILCDKVGETLKREQVAGLLCVPGSRGFDSGEALHWAVRTMLLTPF